MLHERNFKTTRAPFMKNVLSLTGRDVSDRSWFFNCIALVYFNGMAAFRQPESGPAANFYEDATIEMNLNRQDLQTQASNQELLINVVFSRIQATNKLTTNKCCAYTRAFQRSVNFSVFDCWISFKDAHRTPYASWKEHPRILTGSYKIAEKYPGNPELKIAKFEKKKVLIPLTSRTSAKFSTNLQ